MTKAAKVLPTLSSLGTLHPRYIDAAQSFYAYLMIAVRLGERTQRSMPTEVLKIIFEFVCAASSPPMLQCGTCGWRTTGLRCCGKRPEETDEATPFPASARCGRNLELAENGKLRCPAGCGDCELHCCGKPCVPLASDAAPRPFGTGGQLAHARAVASAHYKLMDSEGLESPAATCTACAFTVDALLCCGCAKTGHGYVGSHAPDSLPLNSFFERVASTYVWSCPRGCGRRRGGGGHGGLFHGHGTLRCGCRERASREAEATACASGSGEAAAAAPTRDVQEPLVAETMAVLDFMKLVGPPRSCERTDIAY